MAYRVALKSLAILWSAVALGGCSSAPATRASDDAHIRREQAASAERAAPAVPGTLPTAPTAPSRSGSVHVGAAVLTDILAHDHHRLITGHLFVDRFTKCVE